MAGAKKDVYRHLELYYFHDKITYQCCFFWQPTYERYCTSPKLLSFDPQIQHCAAQSLKCCLGLRPNSGVTLLTQLTYKKHCSNKMLQKGNACMWTVLHLLLSLRTEFI